MEALQGGKWRTHSARQCVTEECLNGVALYNIIWKIKNQRREHL